MIRAFQRMTSSIKFCPRPVVVAPFGFCFGGGAEIALHGARRQVHAELYMGLVETGVGLLPAGGGCKEMTLKAVECRRQDRGDPASSMLSLHRHGESFHFGRRGPPVWAFSRRPTASP